MQRYSLANKFLINVFVIVISKIAVCRLINDFFRKISVDQLERSNFPRFIKCDLIFETQIFKIFNF